MNLRGVIIIRSQVKLVRGRERDARLRVEGERQTGNHLQV